MYNNNINVGIYFIILDNILNRNFILAIRSMIEILNILLYLNGLYLLIIIV